MSDVIYNGYTCPRCSAWVHVGGGHNCGAPLPVASAMPTIGCVCPPGANLQCERVDCPRKGLKP